MININTENIKKDLLGALAVFLFFSLSSVYSILASFGWNVKILTDNNILAIIKYGIIIIVFVKVIPKIKINYIFILLGYFILLAISYFVNTENVNYISFILRQFVFSILPVILIIIYLDNMELFIKHFRVSSYIVMVGVIIIPFSNLYLESIGYMEIAYGSLVSWAMITYYAFKEKRFIDIAISFSTIIIYILFASRGSLLCVGGYLIFCVFRFTKKNQAIISTLAFITIGFILYYNFQSIIIWVHSVLLRYNLSSYSINRILNMTLTESNERSILYDILLKAISENPFGYGIGYDRVLGGGTGYYAHNMFLELYIAFGIIVGSLVILSILYIYIYMIFICKSKEYRVVFSIFGIPGFIMLQLSGSIFESYHIFVAIFIYIMYIAKSRNGTLE